MGGATQIGSWPGDLTLMGLGLGVGEVIAKVDLRRELLNRCCHLRGLAGRGAGPSGRLDLHWFSSGIGHDTDIDGGQENADG